MQQTPHEPSQEPGNRVFPIFSDTDMPRNRRELARNQGLERSRLGGPCESCRNKLAHVTALILRDGSEARKRSAMRPDDIGCVADNETLGMLANGEILLNWYCPVRLDAPAQRPR